VVFGRHLGSEGAVDGWGNDETTLGFNGKGSHYLIVMIDFYFKEQCKYNSLSIGGGVESGRLVLL
jgi:hypothetical protein